MSRFCFCVRFAAIVAMFSLALLGCGTPPTFRVTRAVDGDTLHVLLPEGGTGTVRFIGINTPETLDPRKPVQCYGPEASKRMHALVDGNIVQLEAGPGDDRDRYNRMLRYVMLDGRDLGAQMIEEGFARNYPVFPHARMPEYKRLERSARDAQRGLWAVCAKRRAP